METAKELLRPNDAAADGAWCAELIGDGAHLVGHSFGGCVALDAASRRPDAVRSLPLIEPAMQRLATQDPNVRRLELRMMAILLLLVTGGWTPAFEAVGDAVAAAGAGKRLVVPSEHHFPHLVSDAFNEAWVEFVEGPARVAGRA
jgi:pimeloyl-ACP methyl ester carboxylesterase